MPPERNFSLARGSPVASSFARMDAEARQSYLILENATKPLEAAVCVQGMG